MSLDALRRAVLAKYSRVLPACASVTSPHLEHTLTQLLAEVCSNAWCCPLPREAHQEQSAFLLGDSARLSLNTAALHREERAWLHSLSSSGGDKPCCGAVAALLEHKHGARPLHYQLSGRPFSFSPLLGHCPSPLRELSARLAIPLLYSGFKYSDDQLLSFPWPLWSRFFKPKMAGKTEVENTRSRCRTFLLWPQAAFASTPHICIVSARWWKLTLLKTGTGMARTQLQTAELTENKSESQAGNNYMTIWTVCPF